MSVISPENQGTFIAAAFIAAIFSLGLNLYNYKRTDQVAAAVGKFELMDFNQEKKQNAEQDGRIKALEQALAAHEAASAGGTSTAAAANAEIPSGTMPAANAGMPADPSMGARGSAMPAPKGR